MDFVTIFYKILQKWLRNTSINKILVAPHNLPKTNKATKDGL